MSAGRGLWSLTLPGSSRVSFQASFVSKDAAFILIEVYISLLFADFVNAK